MVSFTRNLYFRCFIMFNRAVSVLTCLSPNQFFTLPIRATVTSSHLIISSPHLIHLWQST